MSLHRCTRRLCPLPLLQKKNDFLFRWNAEAACMGGLWWQVGYYPMKTTFLFFFFFPFIHTGQTRMNEKCYALEHTEQEAFNGKYYRVTEQAVFSNSTLLHLLCGAKSYSCHTRSSRNPNIFLELLRSFKCALGSTRCFILYFLYSFFLIYKYVSQKPNPKPLLGSLA